MRPQLAAVIVATMAIVGFGLAAAVFSIAAPVNHGSAATAAPVRGQAMPALYGSAQLSGFGLSHALSGNWAGYAAVAASNGQTLEAFGEWTVPKINCASNPAGIYGGASVSDNWVGIDGFNTGTVEQAGTYGYCSSSTAAPTYWDWWEFFPYNGIQSTHHVGPGDLIQSYILYNPYICAYNATGVCVYGIYTLQLTDFNRPSADLTIVGDPATCNSGGACENGVDSGAECISEDIGGNLLGHYKSTTFISCDASIGGTFTGIGGFGAGVTTYEIKQLGPVSGTVIQAPSSLTSYDYTNDHFSITWKGYD